MTKHNFHAEDTGLFGATIQDLVAQANPAPGTCDSTTQRTNTVSILPDIFGRRHQEIVLNIVQINLHQYQAFCCDTVAIRRHHITFTAVISSCYLSTNHYYYTDHETPMKVRQVSSLLGLLNGAVSNECLRSEAGNDLEDGISCLFPGMHL
jgi:hypothetical protein